MKITKTEISQKKNQKIQKIKFLNDNNYSIEFFNFGGYFHSINVPYKFNTQKTEDVILGYQEFDEYMVLRELNKDRYILSLAEVVGIELFPPSDVRDGVRTDTRPMLKLIKKGVENVRRN